MERVLRPRTHKGAAAKQPPPNGCAAEGRSPFPVKVEVEAEIVEVVEVKAEVVEINVAVVVAEVVEVEARRGRGRRRPRPEAPILHFHARTRRHGLEAGRHAQNGGAPCPGYNGHGPLQGHFQQNPKTF